MTETHQRSEHYDLWPSPVGWIGAVARDGRVKAVLVHPDPLEIKERFFLVFPAAISAGDGVLAEVRRQISEYFNGARTTFDLPLDFTGISPFTALVLRHLSGIPHGSTITYGELAMLVGRPGAARAVGGAMAANPFAIIVPCHRVVGAKGRLTGYSGGEGIATKKWLLGFERGGVDWPSGGG